MSKDSPSMAKNKIRRSLLAILDPHPSPSEINMLWEYFSSSCAYCGLEIQRDSRTGHMDHVHSSALGGSNSIYNHVLSCSHCNGDNKREEAWEVFLSRTVSDKKVRNERHTLISDWLSRCSSASIKPEQQVRVDDIISSVIREFDFAVAKLRELRKEN